MTADVSKQHLNMVGLGEEIRAEFPIFSAARGQPRAYLDTAASGQKPRSVIDAISHYLSHEHANIHRGAYALSAESTRRYEEVREQVAQFLSAPSPRSIVFTKGTTEAINLITQSYGTTLRKGDAILLSVLEHHSNIVPWQVLGERMGLEVVFCDCRDDASLDMDDFLKKLKGVKPKLVGMTAVSNAFGSVVQLPEVIEESHRYGARVLVDAAQGIVHQTIDVKALDVDFLAFSSHKLYGPTGIGVLYAKEELLAEMEPYQVGGGMISSVTVDGSTWAEYPQKFEAGTPPIAEVIGLGESLAFVEAVGLERVFEYEEKLFGQAYDLLSKEEGLTIYGPVTTGGEQTSILSFNLEGVHAHDLSTIVDSLNVQIRAGHHCGMPSLYRLGIQSSARASIGMYSTFGDFEALVEGIRKAKKVFS